MTNYSAQGFQMLQPEPAARSWPAQRFVMGLRTSKWVRTEVMPHVSGAWMTHRMGFAEDAEEFSPERVARGFEMMRSSASVSWNGPGARVMLRGILDAMKPSDSDCNNGACPKKGCISGLTLKGDWMMGALRFVEPSSDLENDEDGASSDESPEERQISDAGTALCVTLIASSSDLLHLNLQGPQSIFDQYLEQEGRLHTFTYCIRECTALQSLRLTGGWVGETQLEYAERMHLAVMLAHTSATQVDLSACHITDGSLDTLNQAITTTWRVETLKLAQNMLGYDGTEQLVALLHKTPALRVLDLSSNSLGIAAGRVVAGLSRCEHLTSLSLRDNGVSVLNGDSVRPGRELAAGLRALTRLQELNMSRNCLRAGEGLDAVAAALRDSASLKDLDLSGNGIQAGQLPPLPRLRSCRC